jgi:CheY-like chemotaxis protein
MMATTGGEAWQKLQALADQATAEGKERVDQIQCILSDIEMPEMDGFTLTKHIRADPRLAHLPVMLHSSLTGACNMEKGRTVGATDYITKFDAKMLGEKLALHIRQRQPAGEKSGLSTGPEDRGLSKSRFKLLPETADVSGKTLWHFHSHNRRVPRTRFASWSSTIPPSCGKV